MKRFILSSGPDGDGLVRLSGGDYHYLVRVRRLAPGEFFPALLPSGEAVLIQARSTDGGALVGAVCPDDSADPAPPLCEEAAGGIPPLVLLQALPKGDRMDLIVRQAAEGGVTEIIPFASAFSIPKPGDRDGGGYLNKVSRWERIIKEARQQSGSRLATAIRRPLSIDELFAWWGEVKGRRPTALGLLFHHLPLAQASLHGYLNSDPEMVALAVGPEGGFSSAEASRFMEAGFGPLTIGDTVLRTETAALYAAAAIRIILLERNSWEMQRHKNVNG
jgi:16S rRNA (uracil1498-N3)-methyltransferase